VENARPVVRVTNTGITAFITSRGEVTDATAGFQTAARTWIVRPALNGQTFYTRSGDLFAGICAVIGLLVFVISFRKAVSNQRSAAS
jgi:apolipoprotein N-acyltransferase